MDGNEGLDGDVMESEGAQEPRVGRTRADK